MSSPGMGAGGAEIWEICRTGMPFGGTAVGHGIMRSGRPVMREPRGCAQMIVSARAQSNASVRCYHSRGPARRIAAASSGEACCLLCCGKGQAGAVSRAATRRRMAGRSAIHKQRVVCGV